MVKDKIDRTTQEKILQSAREIFFKQGYAGGKMQDIADAAGINKALLHYYFRTKEKLFEVIFLDAFSKFVPQIHLIFETEGPFLEKIENFIRIYITFLSSHSAIPLFVINEINKDPEAFAQKMFGGKSSPFPIQKLFSLINKEIEHGNIIEIAPQHLLINMISLCVFPFLAKPLMYRVMGLSEKQFEVILEQRKIEVFVFIKNALRPTVYSRT